jgi:hypothetical protein
VTNLFVYPCSFVHRLYCLDLRALHFNRHSSVITRRVGNRFGVHFHHC